MPKIELPYTEAGEELVEDVKADVEAIGGEIIYPTTNAPDRMETYQLGGLIKPPTAPSIMKRNPQETPIGNYKKGGKVK